MSFEMLAVLGLLAAAMVVFAFEWVSIDIAAMGLVASLVMLGILTPSEAFAGFASDVIVILGCIFVLSGSLIRTGVMERLGQALYQLAGAAESRVVASVMTLSAGLSTLLSNTNTTAILTPAVIEFSRRSKLSPSRFLIPLAYASMLGGACTLVGTSANLAASGYIARSGMRQVSLFEFAPVGLAMVVAGVAYMSLVGYRLLPSTARASLSEEYDLGRYLAEIRIDEHSEYVDRRLRQLRLTDLGVHVIAVQRGERTVAPRASGRLRSGDVLLVEADRGSLLDLESDPGLRFRAASQIDDADLADEGLVLTEAIVMPASNLLGRSLREIDMRHRYGVSVLAIHHRGRAHPTGLGEKRLSVGDIMLLRGSPEGLQLLESTGGLRVIGEVTHEPFRRRNGMIVLGSLAAAVLAGSTGLLPLSIAFVLAVVLVVVTRAVAPDEMYGMIDWRVMVLIGGMTSVGVALDKTGAADWLAAQIATTMMPLGTYAVMAAFVVLTMVLTQPLSNAAAALVVLPVAISTATQLGLDPRSLAILVTLSASLSFIAPFEPACLIVFSPGKYRFRDFVVAGLPLSAIALVVLLIMVPLLWPLG